jgi:hypothetical protein
MHTALPDGSRRLRPLAFALVAFAFALALALALPSASQAADDQFCYGNVKPIKPDAERDTGAAYEFSCRAAITGFALVSTSGIASFDVAADVFDSPGEGGVIRGDDRFGECEGDIPSFGFRCTGTYTGIGRFVRGTFDGVDSPCARDATGHVAARDSLIVVNKTGKVAGPYELGKAKHCPKAKKTKKTKAKHKKPASRSRAQS